MKKILYLMVGLPGSGKTTFAKQLVKILDNTDYVSRDDIRFRYFKENNVTFNKEFFTYEKQVCDEFYSTLAKSIQEGHDVIADATHLTRKSRSKTIANVKKYLEQDISVMIIYLNIPYKNCFVRNNKRQGFALVPTQELEKMNNNFETPDKNIERNIDHIFEIKEEDLLC